MMDKIDDMMFAVFLSQTLTGVVTSYEYKQIHWQALTSPGRLEH